MAALGVVAFAFPAAAQTDEPLPLRVEDTDTSNHPEVIITVSVPPELVGAEIPADGFTVVEGGVVVTSSVEAVPSDDLEVVLVLDVSGSMAGNPLAAAQSAALSFIDQMPPGVSVAVITFANTTSVASPFTTDSEVTATAILGLRAAGETALYDGLAIAGDQFDSISNTRRSVILLSDGGDTVSENGLEWALVSLLNKDVAFYAVELQTPENDTQALARLGTATGGVVVGATDPDALQGIFEEIAALLTNQYRITYASEAYGPTEVVVTVEAEGTTAVTRETLRLPPAPNPVIETAADAPEVVAEPEVLVARSGSLVQLAFSQQTVALYIGVALAVAGLLGVYFSSRDLRPGKQSSVLLAEERVGDPDAASSSALSPLATRAIRLAERTLQGEREGRLNERLEQAGVSMRPAEFLVMTVIAGIVGFALGYALFAIPGGLLGGLLGLGFARLWLQRKTTKRQAAFADQLPDTLHLIAGSLRAGFGLLQAIDVIASESPSPTAEEFQRVKVEVHLGRDMDEALRAMAERVDSEDFAWVAEGIQIHREVGGDIAEIIDSVNETIRSRNQIRRRIRALSAEGRVSAIVLVTLPFALAVFITLANPQYVGELTAEPIGRFLIGFGLVAMVVGVLWIRRIVRLEF
jgi:tight adherence protein B